MFSDALKPHLLTQTEFAHQLQVGVINLFFRCTILDCRLDVWESRIELSFLTPPAFPIGLAFSFLCKQNHNCMSLFE